MAGTETTKVSLTSVTKHQQQKNTKKTHTNQTWTTYSLQHILWKYTT